MENILTSLLNTIIQQTSNILDMALQAIVPLALKTEEYMASFTGAPGFQDTFAMLTNAGITLIVLKFLKKGFDTYILWTDDPNQDVMGLLTNFCKAMIVALSFPVLYGWLVNVTEELTGSILQSMFGNETIGWGDYFKSFGGGEVKNLVNAIMGIIILICYVSLYIQFLMRGFEILVLRLGMPLACIGLVDNNKGVFAGYLNKLFQSVLSVLVQIVLLKMSITLAVNHPIWAIAGAMLAMKTPRLLQDVIVTTGGGINTSQIYHVGMMAKSLIKTAK